MLRRASTAIAAARFHRLRCLGLLLVAVVSAMSGGSLWAQSGMDKPRNPVRTMWNFWREPVQNEPWPIDLEIVVAYYDPAWGNMWGVSGEEHGYLPFPKGMNIRAHDRVRITGTYVLARGLSVPETTFSVVGHDAPLDTVSTTGKLEDFDKLAHHRVTLDAVVNSEDLSDPHHVQMRLVAEGYRVNLYHWESSPKPFGLAPGTRVRLTGVFNPLHESRADSVEFDLWLAERSDLVVIGNVADDPQFDLPISPIETVHQLYSDNIDRVHVVGAVQSIVPGVGLTVRDAGGEVLVQSLQVDAAHVGDVIEAIGSPFTAGADWLIRKGIIRPAKPRALEAMVEIQKKSGGKLRVASQVLSLSREAAALHPPVDVVGVIMRPRPNTNFLFIKDTSGTVRVDMTGIDNAYIKKGMRIKVQGEVQSGPYVPYIKARESELWGSALLPAVRRVTLDQAMSGHEEGQRIEMRGYVTSGAQEGLLYRLQVASNTGEFSVVASAEQDWSKLIGSVILVRGVCQGVADTLGELESVELNISDREDIIVEQQPLADPFAVPLRPLSSLRQFGQEQESGFWLRLKGKVTLYNPGAYLVIQDGNWGVMAYTKQPGELSPGDVVEVTGFRGVRGHSVVLREARFRKVGTEGEPTALAVDDVNSIGDSLDHHLVELKGKLLNIVKKGETQLLIESETSTFTAVIPISGKTDLPSWKLGSVLSAIGVCDVIRSDAQHEHQFRLLLRSERDVKVLSLPSWWSPQHALAVTSVLGAVVAAGLAWLGALRRRIRQQTELIRSQLVKEANLETRHRGIFEKANDFIFTTDASGRLTSFNPAGEQLTGFRREEALKLNITELYFPEEGGRHITELLNGNFDSGVTFEGQIKRRDGTRVWVEAGARSVRDDDGAMGILGVVRDLSVRKQLENELTRARDAAEANTRMKSTFLANMSHEIRTPMNGVIGMSNILLETNLSREQREFAETIRNSADSLLRVLNDILDFSKMEAGKLELEREPFKLSAVIDGALDLLAPRAAEKKVELAAHVLPTVSDYFKGDAGRIRQVLLNLIGNSLKFTENGQVILSVSPEQSVDGRTTLRFEVIDSGVGMTEEAAARLFKPFVQADASTTRRFGGTGLGLAISKEIVELMHGTIGVESTLGKGSKFWFTLRLEENIPPTNTTPPVLRQKMKNLRVLAVDDLAINQTIVLHYCTKWGLRCDAVGDVGTALDQLADAARNNDPYQLVISDYHMPGKDGLSLVRAMRSDPVLESIPFILFTSIDRRLSAAEVAELKITSVVHKPIRVNELKLAVVAGLGLESSEPTKPSSRPPMEETNQPDPTLRVLVAEDNVVNQRVISIQLRALGIRPTLVGNGRDAVEAVAKNSYDIIFMDCQMPEMDGLEATRQIRQKFPHANVRIVALTAEAMTGDRERCLGAGMDDYLSKPTKPADLRAVLLAARAGTVA